jgi:hypothetical protein
MTTRSPEQATSAGINATYYAASGGGDRVPPGVLLHVKNGNASPLTVTLVTAGVADGDLAIPDRACTAIAATTGMGFIRVPNTDVYRDPADGLVGITWSVTASVTFAVLT